LQEIPLDAQEYTELIKRHIATCQYLEEKPHFPAPIQIPENNPSAIFWRDQIDLRDNYRLVVSDWALFEDGEMVERSFYYDFRKRDGRELIWRICNHRMQQPVSAPCHVHTNPNDEEDRIECFPNSITTIFPYAVHCVKNFYENKPQDWEGPQQ
jgi:hypothetical protein